MGRRIILVEPELLAAFFKGETRRAESTVPKDVRVLKASTEIPIAFNGATIAFLCESAEWDEQSPIPTFKPEFTR